MTTPGNVAKTPYQKCSQFCRWLHIYFGNLIPKNVAAPENVADTDPTGNVATSPENVAAVDPSPSPSLVRFGSLLPPSPPPLLLLLLLLLLLRGFAFFSSFLSPNYAITLCRYTHCQYNECIHRKEHQSRN